MRDPKKVVGDRQNVEIPEALGPVLCAGPTDLFAYGMTGAFEPRAPLFLEGVYG